MKTLKIYSSEERLPKNKEMVLLFKEEDYVSGSEQDVHFCEIEYNLEEIDPETGHWTGCSYSYHGEKKRPKNCKLLLLDNDGCEIFQPFQYAKAKDVDKIFGGKGWKTR